ncbi:hypothetical protein ZWY2020_052621 [Hordeum vulgare]|nr:hypothetical protein ZWY2020_052621 [Hordeum vulgare]
MSSAACGSRPTKHAGVNRHRTARPGHRSRSRHHHTWPGSASAEAPRRELLLSPQDPHPATVHRLDTAGLPLRARFALAPCTHAPSPRPPSTPASTLLPTHVPRSGDEPR